MNVLILHQHFNTPAQGGAIRSYYLARALADHGIRPIVITSGQQKNYSKVELEGIEIHYLPVAYDNRFGFWRRSLSFLEYTRAATKLAGRLSDIKVCYAISVPLTVGIAARRIKSKYRIPYIFEVGDLWPEAPVQMGFIRNGFFKRALYRLERSIYKDAESLVALSVSIEASIRKTSPGKKIHVIPNIADTDFYNPAGKNDGLVKKFGVGEKFVVSYTGAVGFANGLDFFLDCAKKSQEAKLPVHFLLCGAGALLQHLTKRATQLELENINFIPFQNREGVREVLNVTDASFICYLPFKILETGSPNKYFDGLAAGKLILVNFAGWIKDEIEANGCGIFIEPRNAGAFVAKLSAFIENPELLHQYQQASRALAESTYSRRLLAEKFVNIFNT